MLRFKDIGLDCRGFLYNMCWLRKTVPIIRSKSSAYLRDMVECK